VTPEVPEQVLALYGTTTPAGLRDTAELAELLESQVLRTHASGMLGKAHANAVRQAAAETGLADSTFPTTCPYSLDAILSDPLETGTA